MRFFGSGMYKAGIAVTLHFVLCSLPRWQAHEARHHGRYGSEGLLFRDAEALVLGPGRSHARVCNDRCLGR